MPPSQEHPKLKFTFHEIRRRVNFVITGFYCLLGGCEGWVLAFLLVCVI